ncbi:rhodanese-like domain-containing protein [Roseofilum casamattae]|uniref:Rhodanese-like domain-containing protein n=1 Tax=Roseofilum casamattae BLCC-M143 TaxID=3022442 RepID=A0ABT7BTE8_9CYAN|nr:rhodanese-like domain-containing protein [Roseofilum casamattae]MDJ1182330.1 rhodanese-like domain-containing protein [Roseofilum casamattae BLCC-M143]
MRKLTSLMLWVPMLYLNLAIAGCELPGRSNEPIPEIDVARLQKLARSDRQLFRDNTILIDVRTPAEYARDRIGDSPLVPLSEIESGAGMEKIRQLAGDGDRQIILYCFSGVRSARAQQILSEAGISALSLAGGIQAWRQAVPPEMDASLL